MYDYDIRFFRYINQNISPGRKIHDTTLITAKNVSLKILWHKYDFLELKLYILFSAKIRTKVLVFRDQLAREKDFCWLVVVDQMVGYIMKW